MKNKFFLDALSKRDVRCDGKQEFFLHGLKYVLTVKGGINFRRILLI